MQSTSKLLWNFDIHLKNLFDILKKNGNRGLNWMRWDRLSLNKSQGGCVRDMEAFNLSMLGKQGWKLQHDPNSLLTHILKAKYFSRKGFLEAGIGHNPNYTWRSTWSSQNLIKLGYRLKIGDESQIDIWTSPQIRSLPTLKTSTPPSPNTEELSVKDLLNQDMVSWNTAILPFLFVKDNW